MTSWRLSFGRAAVGLAVGVVSGMVAPRFALAAHKGPVAAEPAVPSPASPPASFDEGALIAPSFDKNADKNAAPERAVTPPAPPPPALPAPAPAPAPALSPPLSPLPAPEPAPQPETPPPSVQPRAPVEGTAPAEAVAPLLAEVDQLASLEAATALEENARPRFSMGVAMGISVDNVGIADHRNVMIPSFAVTGGIGQNLLGFQARLFASEAAGRFSTPNASMGGKAVADVGADRQAVDLLLAVRPLAGWTIEDVRWGPRVARALTLNVGLGGERVSVAAQTVFRLGAVVGAQVDLPVTSARDRSQLNVRLSVRRMFGTSGDAGTGGQSEPVGDTKVEALAGLAFVF